MSLNAKTKALKKAGKAVINMSVGEPDYAPPPAASYAGIQAIERGDGRYTPASGLPELRAAIAKKMFEVNGLEYRGEEIVVSNGGKQPLYNAFQAICDPGDEVILPAPYWVSYPDQIRLADAVPVVVSCDEATGFKLTAEQLRRAITARTKAVVLTSPNNPTGSVYTADELLEIGKVLLEHDNLFVVSDEIYDQITFGVEHQSIAKVCPDLKDRTIIMNGFSKVHAMTGWRIGYLAAPLDVAKAIDNFQSHATGSPSAISQHAALAALEAFDPQIVEVCRAKRDLLVTGLNAIDGITCLLPDGALYAYPNVSSLIGRSYDGKPIADVAAFCERLLEAELVSVVPGTAFGSEEHIRMTFSVPEADIQATIERLGRFVERLQA